MTGMTLATLGQLDTCFVRHYFGAESAEELARYGRLMDCLRMIRTVFMIGCDSPTTQRFRPRMLQFARGVFFPQVEQVKEAVRTLLDVCI